MRLRLGLKLKLLLLFGLLTLIISAIPLLAQTGDLTCHYPEDANGWLHCTDQSTGQYYDCQKIGSQFFCIYHQEWHTDQS